MALNEYRDVEVETSSGEDEEGRPYQTVRFTEPAHEEEAVRARWLAC